MKINKMGSANLQPLTDHESSVRAEKTTNFFAADLHQAEDSQSKERLDALLGEITKQGKRLGQVPTYSELKTYRELVRRFVGEAVGRMYSLQTQSGWDRHGRQKMYTIIKQIDEKLAGLTEDVRYGQERQLEIMAKQDAIRGMLVDMYM